MKKIAKFKTKLTFETAKKFAYLSGDKNKIHFDVNFSKKTKFKKPIAHGAHLIALMSRLAGMEIPGKNSIVNSYEISFKKPIFLPCEIIVSGELINQNQVNVKFHDDASNMLYAEGFYTFSLSNNKKIKSKEIKKIVKKTLPSKTFITGASGEMGKLLFKNIKNSIKLKSSNKYYFHSLKKYEKKFSIKNIIYCGWPNPDNQNFLSSNNTKKLTDYYVRKPIEDIIEIAKILKNVGIKNSKLILIGSSYSSPGRHNFKYPYYSLGKSSLSTVKDILSLELGKYEMSCVLLEFDVIDDGMNSTLSNTLKDQASDRYPHGKIPTMKHVIKQIQWILKNESFLLNGSKIKLSGGALP